MSLAAIGHLRRVINCNVSVIYEYDSIASITRLVKGRGEALKNNVDFDLNAEKFSLLFNAVYDDLKSTRKNKQKLNKFLKGSVALTKKKQKISAMCELSQEEIIEIPLLAEKYIRIMPNEEKIAIPSVKIDKQQQHLERCTKTGAVLITTPSTLSSKPAPKLPIKYKKSDREERKKSVKRKLKFEEEEDDSADFEIKSKCQKKIMKKFIITEADEEEEEEEEEEDKSDQEMVIKIIFFLQKKKERFKCRVI